MEDVELSDETLHCWTPSPAPRDAPGVGAWKRGEDAVDRKPAERLADPFRAARTDRSKRDDLVPGLGADLGEAGDHAADVVPDARSRERERAHVDHDTHGPEQTLRNPFKGRTRFT